MPGYSDGRRRCGQKSFSQKFPLNSGYLTCEKTVLWKGFRGPQMLESGLGHLINYSVMGTTRCW